MSRLKRIFSKRVASGEKKGDDDEDESGSEPNDGLVSDTAEDDVNSHRSAGSEAHTNEDGQEWGDWSVHDESETQTSEEAPIYHDSATTTTNNINNNGSNRNKKKKKSSKMKQERDAGDEFVPLNDANLAIVAANETATPLLLSTTTTTPPTTTTTPLSPASTSEGKLERRSSIMSDMTGPEDEIKKKKKKKKVKDTDSVSTTDNILKTSKSPTKGDDDDVEKNKKKKKKDRSKSNAIDSASSFDDSLPTEEAPPGSTKKLNGSDDVSVVSKSSMATEDKKEKRRKKKEDENGESKSSRKEKKKEKKSRNRSDASVDISIHSAAPGLPPTGRRARSRSRSRAKETRTSSLGALKGGKRSSKRHSIASGLESAGSPLSASHSAHTRSITLDKLSGSPTKPSSALVLPTSLLQEGLAPPVAVAGEDAQRQEILRLHQLLSEALQKVATQSAEQIQDKDQFLQLSTELQKVKGEVSSLTNERDSLQEKLKEREQAVESSMQRIDKLEEAIERQLDEQDRMEAKLVRSEDEIDKLLIEIQDLEMAVDAGGGVSDEALRTELKEAKKSLVDKQREVDDQKSRIEHLEKELADSATVNKLQLDELEEEKKALQGKLKGERLDFTSKLTQREETITTLEMELAKYKGNSEFEEIAVVRETLNKTKVELDTARNELEVAQKMLTKTKASKEELLERNNILNENVKVLQKNYHEVEEKNKDLSEKVLKWTEQTYEWKSRAETAERKVESMTAEGSDVGSETGSENAPQGLFLQAIMDKKESAKKQNGRWSIFGRGGQGSDDGLSPEEIRIKALEQRNESLTATISELRSEIVKMQTAHKEEAYTIQKRIKELQEENEALIAAK